MNPATSAAATGPADDLEYVEGLLRRHARNPLSFLLLTETSWKLFRSPSVDGAICYFESCRTAVVWSDPVCAPDDTAIVLDEFRTEMKRQGLGTCFLAVHEATASHSLGLGSAVLKVGEEPVFHLKEWKRPRGDRGKRLRWSLNKAAKAGIEVRRYRPSEGRDAETEARILAVLATWSSSLSRETTNSILRTAPLESCERKEFFLAGRGGRVEAVLACSPVYGRDGWYLEDLIRLPDAPQGTTELLTVFALESLAADGHAFASLGIAPLRGFQQQMDRRARWLAGAVRLVFDRLDDRFHFDALSTYKSKFEPSAWESNYVAISPAWPSLRLIRAVLAVLDGGASEPRVLAASAIAAATRLPVLTRAAAVGLASVSVWQRFESNGSITASLAGVGAAAVLWIVGAALADG